MQHCLLMMDACCMFKSQEVETQTCIQNGGGFLPRQVWPSWDDTVPGHTVHEEGLTLFPELAYGITLAHAQMASARLTGAKIGMSR